MLVTSSSHYVTFYPDVEHCGTRVRGFAYRNHIKKDGENRQETHYFHCDQIGIQREMTDKGSNLLWFGNYTGWGRLKVETKATDGAYHDEDLEKQMEIIPLINI